MKNLLNNLGWVLVLLGVGAWLGFYNIAYRPAVQRSFRQQEEIAMWTREVQNLTERAKQFEAGPDTTFFVAYSFDELFPGPESFTLTSQADSLLRLVVPQLQQKEGTIEVIGHTDAGPVPSALKAYVASNWEFGAVKAAAVLRALAGWGIPAKRLALKSKGSTLPRDSSGTGAGTARNRRVEILIRK